MDGLNRAVPHILHFMSGLKPWMQRYAGLRVTPICGTRRPSTRWHRVNVICVELGASASGHLSLLPGCDSRLVESKIELTSSSQK